MMMISSLYAEVKNASEDIYDIVQRSPVGEVCDVYDINYDISEYENGMFTVSTRCKVSVDNKIETSVSHLHRDDLDRLCVIGGKLLNTNDCYNTIYPEKGQKFSQRHTDIVTNKSPAGKSCTNIKVYQVKGMGDVYNVFATCYYNDLLYFLRERDLYTVCYKNGYLNYGKDCK